MKWTKETCQEEALKFETEISFRKANKSAHNAAWKNNWIDEICSHMIKSNRKTIDKNSKIYIIPSKYNKENCQQEALKYSNKTDFQTFSYKFYNNARKANWLDEICSHMVVQKMPIFWTKEKCIEESIKYNARKIFQKNSGSAYQAALKNGWLDEICSHMILNFNLIWTKEKCEKEALKYSNRTDFATNSGSAYCSARRYGFIDEICQHMEVIGNLYKRLIYAYEFSDNSVYIGLTFNIENRQLNRDKSSSDSVTKHIIETGLQPERKILTDYMDAKLASIEEGNFVEKYKNDGWNILNQRKCGALGFNSNKIVAYL